IDDDCNGILLSTEHDADGDGYRLCDPIPDCNDNDASIKPGAQEVCGDGKDNNCNGQIDEAPCICPDADGDGFIASYCGGTDCNDSNPNAYPGAVENCTDGIDNDCDGLIDRFDPNAVNCPVCTDNDGDGYAVDGGVCGPVDCDDADPKVYPGALEICDGKDSNCDGKKSTTDVDADGDGVPVCAGDCNDSNPNMFPGNIEGPFGSATCSDGIDNNCDTKIDSADAGCAAPVCGTKTTTKNGVHFENMLNPDGSVHPDSGALMCAKCHYTDGNNPAMGLGGTVVPGGELHCQRCHADPSDISDPLNGIMKTQYPSPWPYGFGSAQNVYGHSATVVGAKYGNWDTNCVTCHNPHTQEQDMRYGTTYGKYIKEYICFYNTATSTNFEQIVRFTAPTGTGSFADGPPFNENVCNMCHTRTNHQRNDGLAPGDLGAGGVYVGHYNATDCTSCHTHSGGFKPGGGVPPPHDVFDCLACHAVDASGNITDAVVNAQIPDAKCSTCHAPGTPDRVNGGSNIKLVTHYSAGMTKTCVECHNPMRVQVNFRNNTNLAFIKTTVNGNLIAFESKTGPYSFAYDLADRPADMATQNYICNTCHTQTNHHQADGASPGGQAHFDGNTCTTCHAHNNAFQPSANVPAPHNAQSCESCHVTPNTYVHNAQGADRIPNTACQSCHADAAPGAAAGGSDKKVDTHYSNTYIDPATGQLTNLLCVECHNPMELQTNFRGINNLAFIKTTVNGNLIAFESKTGPYSFAYDLADRPADMATQNYICNTCHTQTNHHQADGASPGGQAHFDGASCSACHPHASGMRPVGGSCLECHNQSPPLGSTDTRRGQIVERTPGDRGGDFARTSHHVVNGPTSSQVVTDDDCIVCHDQSMHTTFGDGVSVLLKDASGGPSYIFNGSPVTAEASCLSCHDGNHIKPFPSDNNSAPNIKTDWMNSAHKVSGVSSCLDCHAQGHGSDYEKILREPNGPGICFNCHDADGPAADNIMAEFTKAYGHDSTLCLECHNVHKSQSANPIYGVSGNLPANGNNWTVPTSYSLTTIVTADQQYMLCFKCHAVTSGAPGGGGTGAAAFTNLGLEFNPNNQSYHPVEAALPATDPGVNGSSRLAASQLTGGWTPGMKMTCGDCHASDSASPKGPHGSAVKWMLAGTNKAWPYTSAANNGTNSGTYFTLGTRTTNNGTNNGLFCLNCHPSTNQNNVHSTGGHSSYACVDCHIRVPHGGKVSRLINAAGNDAGAPTNLPARYWPNGDGTTSTNTNRILVYFNKYSRNSYPQTNACNDRGCYGNEHTAASGESW
ncbi:MAG: MopE-related protein, partial [Nitrospirota bacterium]